MVPEMMQHEADTPREKDSVPAFFKSCLPTLIPLTESALCIACLVASKAILIGSALEHRVRAVRSERGLKSSSTHETMVERSNAHRGLSSYYTKSNSVEVADFAQEMKSRTTQTDVGKRLREIFLPACMICTLILDCLSVSYMLKEIAPKKE